MGVPKKFPGARGVGGGGVFPLRPVCARGLRDPAQKKSGALYGRRNKYKLKYFAKSQLCENVSNTLNGLTMRGNPDLIEHLTEFFGIRPISYLSGF